MRFNIKATQQNENFHFCSAFFAAKEVYNLDITKATKIWHAASSRKQIHGTQAAEGCVSNAILLQNTAILREPTRMSWSNWISYLSLGQSVVILWRSLTRPKDDPRCFHLRLSNIPKKTFKGLF